MKTSPQPVQHYENFPVASVLCPARFRPPITAIYHFARTADDIADEGNASPAERLADLAAYRADLLATSQGKAVSTRWPAVFAALGPMLQTWQLPLPLLTDLLSAFEQDIVKTRYADQAELLDYCRRSANPIGRLLLHLYGVQDANALRQSDCICTALQLVNFWQDLSEDIPRGRIYLPTDMQNKHGVTEAKLLRQQPTHQQGGQLHAALLAGRQSGPAGAQRTTRRRAQRLQSLPWLRRHQFTPLDWTTS